MRHRLFVIFLSMPFVWACSGAGSALKAGQEPVQEKEEMTLADRAENYEQQCEGDLGLAASGLAALEKIKPGGSVASVLEPINDFLVVLDRGANEAALYRNVHPLKSVRDVAVGCEQKFADMGTSFSLSRSIYDAIAALDTSEEETSTQRYVEHLKRDFRRAGVDQDDATRKRVRELQEELIKIGQSFGKNIREDVRELKLDSVADLEGLPEDYIAAHPENDEGKVVLTTNYPDYVPYMTYARSDASRLAFYKEFRKRGYPKNLEVLDSLIAARHELANLLGYRSWSHYVTEDKMIKTDTAAREFIEKIAEASRARASKDYDVLLQHLRKTEPEVKSVGDWQKSFLEEEVKKAQFSFDSQELRQYFPYENVLNGILDLTAEIFGVRYESVDVPLWHPSVRAYEMWQGDTLLGRFFLDMHPREDKYKHAAAFPIRTGVRGKQVPEAALICNFPGGGGGSPLMVHDQVVTFFHEFGHLIHHLFGGDHLWLGVSGFNTEWDFVEAPSQMLEEWAWSPKVLQRFARNSEGQAVPLELIDKMRKARDFGKGLRVAHQMFYASVSLHYYSEDPAKLDTTKSMQELQDKYSPFDYVDDTFFQLSFGHLDGYSAIYYTYMWSLVIAKDLFSVFGADGMMDSEIAGRYRRFVLAPGGSIDAADMVENFLGRPYSFDSFEQWLNAD